MILVKKTLQCTIHYIIPLVFVIFYLYFSTNFISTLVFNKLSLILFLKNRCNIGGVNVVIAFKQKMFHCCLIMHIDIIEHDNVKQCAT